MSKLTSIFNKAAQKPPVSASRKNMFLAPDGADAKVEEFRREVDAILTPKPNATEKSRPKRVPPASKFFDR